MKTDWRKSTNLSLHVFSTHFHTPGKGLSQLGPRPPPRLFGTTRLFGTREYTFDIKHLEGLKNHADSFSRYPVNKPDQDDIAEAKEINTIAINSLTPATQTISTTMDSLIQHAASDKQYQQLLQKIRNNTFAISYTLEEPILK